MSCLENIRNVGRSYDFFVLFLQALKDFIHIDVEVYIAACDGEFLAHFSRATAVTCKNPTMINELISSCA